MASLVLVSRRNANRSAGLHDRRGRHRIRAGPGGLDPDWQPLPADQEIARHVRPKGATPWRVPLVPAYEPCTAPNRTHGPPLAFGSCNPPQPGVHLPDRGRGRREPHACARPSGSVRLDVRLGTAGAPNDADVYIRFSLTNVMRAADLSEYTGELRTELTFATAPTREPGGLGVGPRSTTMDFPFGFTVPCTPTPGSSLDASTCALSTSANALVPGAIRTPTARLGARQAARLRRRPGRGRGHRGRQLAVHDAGRVRAVRRCAVLVVAVLAMVVVTPVAQGAFPGQNGRIAYDDLSNIHTVNPDGSGHAQLTADPGTDYGAEWSPDGERILFSSNRGGLGYQVYVMNADGTGQTRLTDPPSQAGSPAWSPDGNRVVFGRSGALWLMNADGTGQVVLASLTGLGGAPDWSPDGSYIAFVRNDEIWVIRPDGTGLSQVTSLPPWPYTVHGAPDWAPDGSEIAYVHSEEADGEYCAAVVTVRPDGTGGRTVLPPTCESGVSSNNYGDPGWSPDGSRIASRDFALLTVRVDGSDRIDVGGDAYAADWQPLPVETPAPTSAPRARRPSASRSCRRPRPCTAPNRKHGPPLGVRLVQPATARVQLPHGRRRGRQPRALALDRLRADGREDRRTRPARRLRRADPLQPHERDARLRPLRIHR